MSAIAALATQDNELIEELRAQVAIDTSASHDASQAQSNVPYIQHVKQKLEEAMQHYRVPEEYYQLQVLEKEYPVGVPQHTLAFRLGKEGDGGVAFVGHSDVVTTKGEEDQWDNGNPFEMQKAERNGKHVLVGRGVADMKAGNVTAIESIIQAAQAGVESLEKPVYLVLTHSEELGCVGVPDAKEAMMQIKANPELIIVPEPTGAAIVNGHKGVRAFEFEVTGNTQISAADYTLLLANELKAVQEKMINTPDFHDENLKPPYPVVNMGVISQNDDGSHVKLGVFARTTPNCEAEQVENMVSDALRQAKIAARNVSSVTHEVGDTEKEAHHIELSGISAHSAFPKAGVNTIDYLAEVADMVRETRAGHPDVAIHIAGIESGKAANEIPVSASMRLVLTGDDTARMMAWKSLQQKLAEVSGKMQDARIEAAENKNIAIDELPNVGITTQQTFNIDLPATSAGDAIIKTHDVATAAALQTHDVSNVVKIAKEAWGVKDVPVETRPFGTDAGGLREAFPNATTVVFGPGDIANGCHGVGEWIDPDDLRKFVTLNNHAIEATCRSPEREQGKPGTNVVPDGRAPERGVRHERHI